MHAHAAPLHCISNDTTGARAVNETVLNDIRQASGFSQIVQQVLLAKVDHGGKSFQQGKKRSAPFYQALVMKGQPPVAIKLAYLLQTGLKVFQARPGITIIGTKARQLDVTKINQTLVPAVPVDDKTSVAASVTRRMHHG